MKTGDKTKALLAYVLAFVALVVGFHLWHWRNGYPDGTVSVGLSGGQLILIVLSIMGIGVLIGRRWPK
jgi:hypothetical protein